MNYYIIIQINFLGLLQIQACSYLKIVKNWLSNKICKFGVQQTTEPENMGWPSNVTWNTNRGTWSKWLKPPYIYDTDCLNITKKTLFLSKTSPHKMVPDINGTSQKWHLTKMASHKNGTSKLTLLVFWSTANTRLIKPTPAIRQKLKKLDFKTPWPLVWIVLQI